MDAGLSVVVPVYNSGVTLPLLVATVSRCVDGLDGIDAHEIILVDDDSVDDSWKVIEALADEHPHARGVRLARNAGEQCATLCGIDAARFDRIVTMDDDLQHGPESIADLLGALSDDVELVYGLPDRDRHGVRRRFASRLTKAVLEHVFRVPGARTASAFRAFRTTLRDRFPVTPGPLVSVDALLGSATSAIAVVSVPHHRRRVGRSQYTTAKLITHTMSIISGGSTNPLMFATASGLTFLSMGSLGLVVVTCAALLGSLASPVPWLLVAVAAVATGILFLALGVLGELLARVLQRAGGQPTYVIRETTGPDV